MRLRRKKGMVLLQTLVMSVILSMVSVMMMKWVIARYTMAARNYRANATLSRAGGYSQAYFSTWNAGGQPGCGATINGQTVSCNISGGAMRTVVITANQDQ